MAGSGSEPLASALVDEALTALEAVPRFKGDELRRAVVTALCESYPSCPPYARAGLGKEIRESLDGLLAAVPVTATVDVVDDLKNRRAQRLAAG